MMTAWLLIILAIIITHYLLDTTVSLLNLKSLSTPLPEEFKDVFDSDEYAKSQNYTKTNTRFSIIQNSVSSFLTLAFLLLGGFNYLDQFARSMGYNEIITGIIFTFGLLLLSFFVGLPFSIYSTFRIEAHYGLNRTTVRTFVTDIIKSLALSVLLGAPILALILSFFEYAGAKAWMFCWFGMVLFGFVLQFLAPVLIMPLFNKFTPLEENSLKDKIQAYAKQQDFQIRGIFTMDGSKRSAKLNAFFTGFGRFRKIVFFDTLLEKLSDEEILAVLAHEMGHFKKKHIWKMMAISIAQTGIMFFLLSLFIRNEALFEAFKMEELSTYASLVFFAFLYAPLNTIISVIFNVLSRVHEFEADRYAATTTGQPGMLVNGLKKLSKENLSHLTPHPFVVFLRYSHPPILSRIRTLNGMAG